MNLPNYFLADVPDAPLDPETVLQACHSLKANRRRFLQDRPTSSLIRTLSNVAESWLEPAYPLRVLLQQACPAHTGFTAPVLFSGLDDFFRQLNASNLQALVQQDLGHLQRLDDMSSTEPESKNDRAAFARGPELLAHVTGGIVPCPALTSIVLALLARSSQFLKCATGTSLVPRLFAHSIHQQDPKLASTIEIAEWKGGSQSLDDTLFTEADCVMATGSNETLSAIRQKLPGAKRFLGYGHRISLGYVTAEALSPFHIERTLNGAASDVAAWDQAGCLSPHAIYVEEGGKISPLDFAEELAKTLDRLESTLPRRPLPLDKSAAIDHRRAFYKVRAAHSLETKLIASEGSTAWTVVYEADPQFQLSCLDRFIYVKPIAHENQWLEVLSPMDGKISTLGIAGTEERIWEIARAAPRRGITRVCPLGKMQRPSFLWRHDGRPALADLITWIDWELK